MWMIIRVKVCGMKGRRVKRSCLVDAESKSMRMCLVSPEAVFEDGEVDE